MGLHAIDSTVDLSRAEIIPGLMDRSTLRWLGLHARWRKRIVEVGSFMGCSTRALADNTQGIVHAIDNWEGPWDVDLSTETRSVIFSSFYRNLKDHIESGKVIPITADHSCPPRGLKPDMVFIDGDHTFESETRNILFWKNELGPGGLLCGDDFNIDSVRRAVEETLGQVEVNSEGRVWSKTIGLVGG